MPSIELLLDADADAAVREQWVSLADAGIRSQHHHAGASNAPHVTAIFATTALPPAAPPPPRNGAMLGGLLVFPGRRGSVLARTVVVTAELLAWQSELRHSLPVDAAVDPHTEPGAWTPHVTLARSVPGDRLGDAIDVVGRLDLPITFPSVRMWDAATQTLTVLHRAPAAR